MVSEKGLSNVLGPETQLMEEIVMDEIGIYRETSRKGKKNMDRSKNCVICNPFQ